MDNIGERIKKERERLGLSQAELGRLVGYSSRSTINKIEKGERDIPRDKVAKFAQVLGVNPAYLAGFTEQDNPDGLNLNKEYYIDYLLETQSTSSNNLCIKIKASDLDDSEVEYMDKQLDFIVGQRKLLRAKAGL